MSAWIFLKTFSDLCLYFSALSAFPSLFFHSFSYIWSIGLCCFGVGMASVLAYRGKLGLRYLGMLPIVFSLVLVSSLLDFLILVPPVFYAAAVIVQGQFSVEYGDYRAFFVRSISIWAVSYTIVSLYCAVEAILLLQEMSLNYVEPFWYGLLYAVSGVILLRFLRMGDDSHSGERKMNTAQTVAVMCGTGVVLFGAVMAERYLQKLDTSVLQELWIGLFSVLMVPVHALVELIVMLLPDYDEGFNEHWNTEPTSTTPTIEIPPTEEGMPQPVQPVEEIFPWWLVILILGALTLLLIVMIRRFVAKRNTLRSGEQIETIQPPPKREREKRRSNRNKIRHYYREYLRGQRRMGTLLRSDQTSLDILRISSEDTDIQAATQLREMYLYARYDLQGQISREQAETAKMALKKSRVQ